MMDSKTIVFDRLVDSLLSRRRSQTPYWERSRARDLQNETLRSQPRHCQVPLLVLHAQTGEDEEGNWWDSRCQRGKTFEERLADVGRSTRAESRSRTTESGWDTTLVPALTTCTRSTVTLLSSVLSSSATRRWLELTVLVTVPSRSSAPPLLLMRIWRDTRTSCTLTRTWSSLSLTATTVLSPRSTRPPSWPRSLALSVDKLVYDNEWHLSPLFIPSTIAHSWRSSPLTFLFCWTNNSVSA